MLKSKKTILGILLCAVMALCVCIGALGLSKPNTVTAKADSTTFNVTLLCKEENGNYLEGVTVKFVDDESGTIFDSKDSNSSGQVIITVPINVLGHFEASKDGYETSFSGSGSFMSEGDVYPTVTFFYLYKLPEAAKQMIISKDTYEYQISIDDVEDIESALKSEITYAYGYEPISLYDEEGNEDYVDISDSWIGDVIKEEGTHEGFDYNYKVEIKVPADVYGEGEGNIKTVEATLYIYVCVIMPDVSVFFDVYDRDYGDVDNYGLSVVYGTPYSVDGNVLTIGDEDVTATANKGYEFSHWELNGYPITSGIIDEEGMSFYAVFESAPSVTITDILATVEGGFPTFSGSIPSNAWTNSAGSKLFVNGSALTLGGVNLNNCLSASVTKNGNNYEYSSSPMKVTFVIESDKLVKVILEGSSVADYDGEYLPPAVTVSDILNTVEGGFPTSDDDFPANSWINENESKLMFWTGMLYAHNEKDGDYTSGDVTTITLTKDGNNYKYTDSDGVTVTFIMEGDALTSIKIEGYSGGAVNGTYAPAITVESIFNTVANVWSWTSDKGESLGDVLSSDIYSELVTTSDNLTYTLSYNGMNISLVTDGATLQSITIANASFAKYDGTYTAPAPAEEGFGIILGDGTTIKGQKNEGQVEFTEYIIEANLTVGTIFQLYDLGNKAAWTETNIDKASTSNLKINADNVYEVTADGKYTIYLKMISYGNNQIYVAYEGATALTIADILATNPDFPTSNTDAPANAWVSDNGHTLYSNGTCLYSDTLDNEVVGLKENVIKSGDSYYYTHESATITFNIVGGVLTSIELSGVGDFTGTYSSVHVHSFTYSAIDNVITATCDNADGKCELTDCKLTLTLTAPISFVYDGNPKAFTFADGEADAWTNAGLELPTIIYNVKQSGQSTYLPLMGTLKFVGDYMAQITVDGKTASVQFSITKASATVTADPNSKVYGENDPTLTATVSGIVDGDTLDYTLTRTEGEDVGWYDIILSQESGANANYDITFVNGEFEIRQKEIKIVIDDKEKIYGEDDPVFTYHVAEGYSLVDGDTLEIFYEYGPADDYTAQPPFINVGEYQIIGYQLMGGNYNYLLSDITYGTFTIAKAQVEKPSEDTTEFTYNGNPQTYNVTENELYKVTDNVQTDAGEYTVTVELKDKANYKWKDGDIEDLEFTFVIAKATYDMTGVTFENATYTYDGEEKTLVISGTLPEGVSVAYTTNTLTNVGSVEVTATFTGDTTNYNAISDLKATLTITRATGEITVDLTPIVRTYGESFELPTATSNFGEVTCDKTLRDLVNVNTYTVTYTLSETTNYTGDQKSLSVVINRATGEITVDTTTVNAVYGEKVMIPVATCNVGFVICNMGSGEIRNAGTYTAIYTLSETPNYTGDQKTVTVVVAKKQVEKPVADKTEFEYTGNVLTYNIEEQDYYTISGNKQTESGEYTVTVSLKYSNNYEWIDGTTDDLTFSFVIDGSGLSAGAIVGIVLGSVVFVAIVIYVLGYFFLYKKGKIDDKKINVIYKFLPKSK